MCCSKGRSIDKNSDLMEHNIASVCKQIEVFWRSLLPSLLVSKKCNLCRKKGDLRQVKAFVVFSQWHSCAMRCMGSSV